MITTKATISYKNQIVPPLVNAVQGDTGRNILFTISDYEIPAGATATFYIQKPSKEAVYNTAVIDASNNTVEIELTAQCLAEYGENFGQIRIMLDGEVITSFDFILLVKTFRGIDAIESTSETNIFDQAVEAAAGQFQTEAEAIVDEVIESIPEDYSALSQDVTDLKADLKGIANTEENISRGVEYNQNNPSDWLQARIYNYTRVLSATNRIMFNAVQRIQKNSAINVIVPNGYKYVVLFSANYIGSVAIGDVLSGFSGAGSLSTKSGTIIAPDDAKGFIVVLGKSDDSDLTPNDIPTGLSIYVESYYDTLLRTSPWVKDSDFTRNTGYYRYADYELTFAQGYWAVSGNSIISSTTRCYANSVLLHGETLRLIIPDNMKGRMNFLDANGACIDTPTTTAWTNGSFEYSIPEGAVKVGISVAYQNNATILPGDCANVTCYSYNGVLPPDLNLAEFNGKRISILGDSISTFTGYSYPGNRCRYPQDNLLTDVNLTYWMRLINHFGMVLGISETWAGSRVSNTASTDSGDVGPNRCIASATRIGHLGENGTPDIILVNAGTNDIGASVTVGTFNTESPMNYTDEEIANLPVDTFADAYRTMLIRLQKSYPTSMIVCLLPNYTTSYYTPAKADQYCEIIKEACDYFGIKWFDMRTCGITIFNRATYLPDGIHPNASGMKLMFEELNKDFQYDVTLY